MSQLKVIGTSHIAKESVHEVEEAINSGLYHIVAIELDEPRLGALLQKNRPKRKLTDVYQVGIQGYFFSIFGEWAEKKLGESVGMKPGSEMITAYKLAKKTGLSVALIDQRIDITLKRFSKEITWKEKWNFIVDLVKGTLFRKSEFYFDIKKVPPKQVMALMMEKVKKRYPNFYKVLVTERNSVMARNLARLMLQNPDKRIVAVIGAGHEEELVKLVNKILDANITYSYSIG